MSNTQDERTPLDAGRVDPLVRRLPDYDGVAATISDFLSPDELDDTIVVRRGLLRKADREIEAIAAACKRNGSCSIVGATCEHGRWSTSFAYAMGSVYDELASAIETLKRDD